jgi:hypothetical protein
MEATLITTSSPKTVKQIRDRIAALGAKAPLTLRKGELLLLLSALEAGAPAPSPFADSSSRYYSLVAKWADLTISWRRHLRRHGWCVVPLHEADGETLLDGSRFADALFSHLESCSPVSLAAVKEGAPYARLSSPRFRRDDPTTWKTKDLPMQGNGVFKQYVNHSPFMWELRELAYPIFARLLRDDDLLCSFDGACFLRPLELTLRGEERASFLAETKRLYDTSSPAGDVRPGPATSGYRQWLHIDRDRLSETTDGRDPTRMVCAQGLVNFLSCGEEDGGLVVVEGSHREFASYLQRHPSAGYGSFAVDMGDPALSGLSVVKVCSRAGELVLWDSRTVHANCPPARQQTEAGAPRITPRMCGYVSMMHRSHATAKELEKRIKLFESSRGTGHDVCGHLLRETPRHPLTRGSPVIMPEEPHPVPELSALGRRLVGYVE